MPRIRQNAQRYADTDFWREIQSRKALTGIKTDKELAGSIGLSASSFCKRKQSTEDLTVASICVLQHGPGNGGDKTPCAGNS